MIGEGTWLGWRETQALVEDRFMLERGHATR